MTYAYDANGNVTSDGVWTHSWNYQDRISSSTDGTTTLNYDYDENGQRYEKTNATTSSDTLYINQYSDLEDSVADDYIYAGGMKVASVKAVPSPIPADPSAELASTFTAITYHSPDQLSSTSVDTNDSGDMVEVLDYYPFGGVRLDDNAVSFNDKHKYTGKELDAETGLSYYEARYYDAAIGKFVSLDSWEGDLSDPQSFNKYAYVKNNPFRYVDVTGNQAVGVMPYDYGAAAVGAVGSAFEAAGAANLALLGAMLAPAALMSGDTPTKGENVIIDPIPTPQKSKPFITPVVPESVRFKPSPLPASPPMPINSGLPIYRPDHGLTIDPIYTGGKEMGIMNFASGKVIGGIPLSDHAGERMKERGISEGDVEDTIKNGESFDYGDKQKGYYHEGKNIFVGTGDKITTVFSPGQGKSYIDKLKNK